MKLQLFNSYIITTWLLLFISQFTYGQTLTYRVTNPRIVSSTKLEFEIQVKSSVAVYADVIQANFYFNSAAFNPIVLSYAVVGISAGFSNTEGAEYSTTLTGLGSRINVALISNHGWNSGDDLSEFYQLINTDWVTMIRIRVNITDKTQESGIYFDPTYMLQPSNQKYVDPTLGPNQFFTFIQTDETKSIRYLYLGRIFCSAFSPNWTQFTSLLWSVNENTSIWEGNAAITQADYTEALANNVRVETGATLTIPTKKWLTVSGNMTILGAAPNNLVVASGGSLKQNTSGVQATVGKDIGAWGTAIQGWHLLSSPVAAQVIDPDFITTIPGNYDFYCWHEPSNLWVNYKGAINPTWSEANVLGPINGGGNFIPGKGYLVAYATTSTKQFTGSLNYSDLTASGLTNTGGIYMGWNLLGNPFPCALKWNDGSWTLNNVDELAQIWSDATASYTVINANGIIPAMQGFMVHVPSGTGDVTIPAGARTHSTQAWYKKTTGNPCIKLVASNPGTQTAQESVVTFDSRATYGYDGEFDSYFLEGYAPQFYSVAGAENLAYNTLPNLESQTVIPFNFIKTDGTSYTIEATQIENVPTQVYLTDLKINKTQSLGENSVYTFTAIDGDDPARFLLSFGHIVGSSEKTLNNEGIYTYENNLYLVNPGKSRLEVYNLTGQKLQAMDIDSPGLFRTTLFLPTAYYVVRLTTGTKVIVTKVFIKS